MSLSATYLPGEPVKTEDGDDVLQLLVLLEHRLHAARDLVVLLPDDVRVEDTRGGVERVDGGVDAELGDLTRENRGRIEMRKCCRRRGVGQVVRRDIDRLHGRDRALLRRGDTLLQSADVGRQRRLVANGGRHTSEQRRDLGTCLDETEDVVNEEQHVLSLHVAEVLRHRESRQCHAHTRSGRLVHLTVDECGLVDNARLGHLRPEVVALTRTLADTGEDGVAAVLGRDVVDELHDENGLADTCAAKETNLSAARVRSNQVNDLDARLKDLGRCLLIVELRRRTVDRPALLVADGLGVVVNRLAEDVEHASEGCLADGHLDRCARIVRLHAAHQAVGGAHGDAARDAVAEMLHDLDREIDLLVGRLARDLDGV